MSSEILTHASVNCYEDTSRVSQCHSCGVISVSTKQRHNGPYFVKTCCMKVETCVLSFL